MISRPRTKRALAIAALVTASGAVAIAAAQSARRGAVKDTSSVVVATVNGEKITRGDVLDSLMSDEVARMAATDPRVQNQLKQQPMPTSSLVGKIVLRKMSKNGWKPVSVSREEILDYAFREKPDVVARSLDVMIRSKAVSQAAKKAGVVASDAEVSKKLTASLDQLRSQNPAMKGQSDAITMKALGVVPKSVRPLVETQVNLEKLARKDVEQKLGHPLGPADFRSASHILIKVNTPAPGAADSAATPKPADTEKLWADAKTKLEGILADIRAGKITFEQAAQQYSDDGSKFRSGDLGPFTRGQMVGEFEKAAFSQEKGKVGDLVKTQFGYHIIRVDKTGAEMTAPEREEVITRLLNSKIPGKMQEIMTAAKIDNKIQPAAAMGMGMGGPGGGAPAGR
jgi:parvulin-like peptidyl-prolyl isomerase